MLGLLTMVTTANARQESGLSLHIGSIVIPQVDYEPWLTMSPEDGMPRLDLRQVDYGRVIDKEHVAITMESAYLRVVFLPRMGRVYSMHFKPTDHETLWRNDIVRPGGANNRLGWWLWIGGIEYTLPGEEHGYTWALPWEWEILEDGEQRKALRLQITEPTTGLRQRLEFSLAAGSSALQTSVSIHNPTPDTVEYAHWVNPMWTPGGQNELTDNTELIIPTKRILIAERWQKNLGASPQQWTTSPLRFMRNWADMGDLMADGLTAGFYGAYSHDTQEGVVRVFDPVTNPGVDVWTYGYHPDGIPMGSGAPNKGYAEMWGGTSVRFPDEMRPLAPDQTQSWTEWIYPFQQTQGLTWANQDLAVRAVLSSDARLEVRICPTSSLSGMVELWTNGIVQKRFSMDSTPAQPWSQGFDLPWSQGFDLDDVPMPDEILVTIRDGDRELARVRPKVDHLSSS